MVCIARYLVDPHDFLASCVLAHDEVGLFFWRDGSVSVDQHQTVIVFKLCGVFPTKEHQLLLGGALLSESNWLCSILGYQHLLSIFIIYDEAVLINIRTNGDFTIYFIAKL